MRLVGHLVVIEMALLICIHLRWIDFPHHITTEVRRRHEVIGMTIEEDTVIDSITIEALLRSLGAEDHLVGAPKGMKITSLSHFVPMTKNETG